MNRLRWHNLKYYTWVEQQGKSVEELNKAKDQEYWHAQAKQVEDYDRMITAYKEEHKEALNKLLEL
jgi:hypothetical protein